MRISIKRTPSDLLRQRTINGNISAMYEMGKSDEEIAQAMSKRYKRLFSVDEVHFRRVVGL